MEPCCFEPIGVLVACSDLTILSTIHEISSRDDRIKVHTMDPQDFMESFLWNTAEHFQYELLLLDLAVSDSVGPVDLSRILSYDWTVILLGEVPPSILHDLERNSKVFSVVNTHSKYSIGELRFTIYRALQHRYLQMFYSANQAKDENFNNQPCLPTQRTLLDHSSPMEPTSTSMNTQPTKKRKSLEGDNQDCYQNNTYPLISPSARRRTSLDNEPLIIPIHYKPSPTSLEPSTASWADIAHSLFYDLTGERFFHEAARYLSRYLQISCACIGEYLNTQEMKVWSLSMDQDPITDSCLSIANTPLQVLLEDFQTHIIPASAVRSCLVYNGNALKSFPQESFLSDRGYTSCICCRLSSETYKGVIAVFDVKEFEDVDFVTSVLKLFAVRASAEMERLKMEHALSHRLAMEYALTSISTLFIKDYITDKKSCIEYALKTMSELLGAERACMFQVSHDEGCEVLSLFTEWVASSAKPTEKHLCQVPLAEFPLDMESLKSGDILRGHTKSVDSSQPKSFIYVPIMEDGEMIMFFGFDFFSPHEILPQDSDIFRMLSQITGYSEQRLKTKEELIVARDLAEAGSRSKSEFLGMVSHELRTPLNGVIANTLFLLDTELTPAQKEYAQVTKTCGEALLRIINDVIDFTQMESGQLPLVVAPFNLRNCIEHSLAVLSPMAAVKGIQISATTDCNLPSWVKGDTNRISQVLCALCSNAIKFTDKGTIQVGCNVNNIDSQSCKFTISIKDSGIGLSEDDMHRIFQPFIQIDSSNTRKFQGTGIGLTLCRKIVLLMGGDIWVQSQGRGEGATFSFSLDLPIVEPCAQVAAPKLIEKTPCDVSVLVVDDNLVNQTVMTRMLKKVGCCNTEVASNGIECLEKLKKGNFDLIFLDLMMPLMDGFKCFENIKNKEGRPWVIAMTAQAYDADKKACIGAGMDGYLTKPILLEDLMEKLSIFQQTRDT